MHITSLLERRTNPVFEFCKFYFTIYANDCLSIINAGANIGDVYISAITVTELHAGLPSRQEKTLYHLFSVMDCIGIDEAVAKTAGEYLRKWRRSHGLEVPDALIAATAKQRGLALVTLNRRHFPMDDLEIVIPYVYS